MATVAETVARTFREHHGWVLARLVRRVHDLDLAEDALGQALEAALTQWPRAGIPDEPRAWLVRAARNRAIDELRRRRVADDKSEQLAWLDSLTRDAANNDDTPIRDDMLRLVFTCCHPALSPEARVALTLREIAGLETGEIARAFLVPATTMAQRLVRAKAKIRKARVPYRVPDESELDGRVPGVLSVVYLIFNEGYLATTGPLVRTGLCRVAIGLCRDLCELLPAQREARGLLSLMLLHDSRREARAAADGSLVLLQDQDRSLWRAEQMDEGRALLRATLREGLPGPLTLQAAIAAVHADAASAQDTDWAQIVGLYDRLVVLTPTAVVALNRAVAVAMHEGEQRGLAEMEPLGDALRDYGLYHAARADLLRRLGSAADARDAYRRALACPCNEAERSFLEARLAALDAAEA